MKKQSYRNHVRLHPLYHFVLFPLTFLFILCSGYLFYTKGIVNKQWIEGAYHALAGAIALIVSVLIRSYPLKIQDRLIRTEIRMRYLAATGQHFNGTEKKLSTHQLTALRFASDTELPTLIEQTVTEELPALEIKKRIRKWKGDYYRI